MTCLSFVSRSPEDHPAIAQDILAACVHSRIFACYGTLGAGKTTLIKSLCRALGVTTTVSSPTFNLVNEYDRTGGKVYHFDFYRIRTEAEAYDVGLDEYLASSEYVFIEWPERIPTLLPPEAVRVHIAVGEDHSRQIDLSY